MTCGAPEKVKADPPQNRPGRKVRASAEETGLGMTPIAGGAQARVPVPRVPPGRRRYKEPQGRSYTSGSKSYPFNREATGVQARRICARVAAARGKAAC